MPTFDKVTSSLRRLPRPSGWIAWFLRPAGVPGRLRVRWLRVAGAAAAAALLCYLAAATALYGHTRFRRGIASVRYLDLVLPSRWDRFRTAVGEHQLEQAEHLRRAGRFAEALVFARAGIVRAPAHREGRILAARLLGAAGRADDAHRLLLEGLAHHPLDPTLLTDLLHGLWQRQEDHRTIELVRQLAPTAAHARESLHLLLTAGAAAALARGHFDAAEDFVHRDPALAAARSGRHLLARIDWERGLRPLALVRIRQLATEHPGDAAIHRDLADWLRASGHADEARRAVLGLHLALPHRPEPRLELIRDHHAAGDAARRDREIADYLDAFPADAGARLALADFAASAGNFTLAESLAQHARAQAWESAAFELLAIEAHIAARRYSAALDLARALRAANPDPAPQLLATLHGLLALAHQGLGDTGTARSFLGALLTDPRIRSATLVSVARRLDDLGAGDSARQLLRRVVELDPLDQPALSRLIELDLAARRFDSIHDLVRRLLTLRRPSPDLLLALRHELSGDRFLFSAEAAATIAAIAAAAPAASAQSAPSAR